LSREQAPPKQPKELYSIVMTSHFLKNATVISVDPKLGVQSNCDILIKDGIIKEVGQNLTLGDGATVIDCTNCLVSPGFVDTHHHLWQQLIRGLTTDWSLADYAVHIRRTYCSLL
jgi:cytosine/adenosine deaminase-related metal-dependent hydrolase